MTTGHLAQVHGLGARGRTHPVHVGRMLFDESSGVHALHSSKTLLLVNSILSVPGDSMLLSNRGMDIKDIRRENLLGLIREIGDGEIAELARKTGQDPSYLSQIKNGHRNLGNAAARNLEKALEKPKGWLDHRQFATGEDAVIVNEMMQLKEGLSKEDFEAWLRHGRLLMKNQPKGPNNPFGNAPAPKGSSQ